MPKSFETTHLRRPAARVLGLAVLLIAVCAPGAPLGAQPRARTLFSAAPPGRAVADAQRHGRPSPKRQRMASVRADLLAADEGSDGPPIEMNLFDDVDLRVRVDHVERRSPSAFVWHGRIDGAPDGHAVFASNEGVLAGTVFIDGATFEVSYAGDGLYDVRELDPAAFPTDDPTADIVPEPGRTAPVASTAADGAAEQDLLVVWTPAARTSAGGTAAIRSVIDVAVANANTGYAKSGVATRLRLVYQGEIAYGESSITTDLDRLASTADGSMDAVHALRDQYGADVVSLVGAGYISEGACGIGYLMSSVGSWFAPNAFNVVDWSCAAGNLTLAHEIGHNQGLHHDPANASGQAAYPYSYGYVDPSCAFRTVMAYGGCQRVTQFSSPNVTYNGRVTGTSTQDNARTLNNTAATVANFRQSVTASCSYSVTPQSIAAAAGGQSVSVSVSTASGCGWTATSNASWISVTGGASGSGEMTLSIAVNGEASGRTGSVTIAGKTVTVTQAGAAKLVIARFTSDHSSPVMAGTAVTWTATLSGGLSPVCKFWLLDASVQRWDVLQDWGQARSATWTPATTGTYALQVWCRNSSSDAAYDAWMGGGYVDVISPPPPGITLVADREFPISTGTSVTWTADASGISSPSEYEFWAYDSSSASWSLARPYGSSNTFTWTPLRPGNYAFQVWSRAAGSQARYDVWTGSGFLDVTPGPPTVLSVSPSQRYPVAPGVPVTWTITAAGAGPFEYKFWLYSTATNTWSVLRDWSTTSSTIWEAAAGTYAIQGWVRTIGSTAAYESWLGGGFMTVASSPAKMESLSANQHSFPLPAGTSITWTAESSGGTAAVEYCFWRLSGGVWLLVQPYSGSATYSWTPTSADAGAHALQAWVRSVGSTSAYESWMGGGYFDIQP